MYRNKKGVTGWEVYGCVGGYMGVLGGIWVCWGVYGCVGGGEGGLINKRQRNKDIA